jgi:MSHA pilin protein MshA
MECLVQARAQDMRTGGFTVIELVVTITIVGILAALAIPRFISMDTKARIASVNSLAGALQSAAELSYATCMTSAATSGCNTTVSAWQGTINGQPYWLNYGWPDAGDALNAGQIDSQVDYTGFSVSLVSNAETLFDSGQLLSRLLRRVLHAPQVSLRRDDHRLLARDASWSRDPHWPTEGGRYRPPPSASR